MSRTIALSRGYVTIVDDEDYERLSQFNWRAVGTQWVYAQTTMPGVLGKTGKLKAVRMYRYLMNVVDAPSSVYVDHRNGDTLDNRKENLRITDNKGNQGNRHAPKLENATSRFRGVVWSKAAEAWLCRIKIDRHLRAIGLFDDEVTAAMAYDVFARLHFGDFARLNLPGRENEHAMFLLTEVMGRARQKRVSNSGVEGVSQKPDGRWRAYVSVNGKHKHVGYFSSREQAAKARENYLAGER